MLQENISDEFAALPPEAQRQVIDFMNFLKSRYVNIRYKESFDFSDEPFIGIWRHRDEMRDSSKWVRNIRNSEWAPKDD
jgi:hypothetical protein